MTPAFLATLLFALSVVLATRTTRLLGAMRANLARLCVSVVLLALFGHAFGQGWGGGGFAWFFLSGCIGFGVGDLALFASLPRIGPRLAGLLIQCLAAPFAALAEWLWMGTVPTLPQLAAGVAILAGVALAVAPKEHAGTARRVLVVGVVLGVVAALGQGLGAVISRRAYAAIALAGGSVDGMTAAYQRMLGGFLVGAPASYWLMLREQAWFGGEQALRQATPGQTPRRSLLQSTWFWVISNAVAGPIVGVACYQWALKTAPSGVVLPIVATMPILLMPITFVVDGDRPTLRSVAGGVLAVGGAVALTTLK